MNKCIVCLEHIHRIQHCSRRARAYLPKSLSHQKENTTGIEDYFRQEDSKKRVRMENKEIASYFKLCGQLMELHEENKFKVRSYANAGFQISKYPDPIEEMDPDYYGTIPGLGTNLIPKLEELLDAGRMSYLEDWIDNTPKGILEMLKVKGIGPSKVRLIWKELELESTGELLYACNENRLVDLKGFGEKTQAQVKASIEFMMEHKNSFHYATIEPIINEVINWVIEKNPNGKIAAIGDAARKSLTLEQIDFITCGVSEMPEIEHKISISFDKVDESDFELELFKRSATQEHLKELSLEEFVSADKVYGDLGISTIPTEMREGQSEFQWASKYTAGELVTDSDLLGCLHNHSTYSDGVHSLRQMSEHLKSAGYEYFGISDHSKTAVYAGGLRVDEIVRQHEEIEQLNSELDKFRVLKGIESDILSNGDLDYEVDVLRSFDFIVASIHSAMKMDESAATARLVKAIENPYTKILGHPTGRLLLSRPGYPINHKKIIGACAENGVAIELNANPMRLDIDWKWIPYCMEKEVMISINPDAHRLEGFDHMRFGVMAARKGGLVKANCLNALPLNELLDFFGKK
jgi:DNA polymerase (family 10)